MKSLRVRFFVVTWLLVVSALVSLGAIVNRWSSLELQRVAMSATTRVDSAVPNHDTHDSVAAAMATGADLAPLLQRIVSRDTGLMDAVVIDSNGGVVAAANASANGRRVTLVSEHSARYDRVDVAGGLQRRIAMSLPLTRISSAPVRYLLLVPDFRSRVVVPSASQLASRALSRRIITSVLVGSVMAAVVTVLLSGPLVGRVGALSRATAALRRGELDARVASHGSDEIAQLSRSFNQLASGLQESERQRRQMITDIAHELRTPLTNVLGLADSIRDGIRPADPVTIDAIHAEASLLNRLVDDLRDLSLADAGELRLDLSRLDATAEAVAAVNAFAHADRDIPVRVGSCTPNASVTADSRRLAQVLRNLIQNARTYASTGSVVTVNVDSSDATTTFSVANHGTGIDTESLPRVWERFYRVDPSRDRATGGMGIGLAMVKRLVELQHGTVAARSIPGEETVFSVTLPS